ncbi:MULTISPECIES: hypothetical protein [Bacillati]|jgi:hypothetical protein|uniref:hypothetical protein n=1 Tax=Bacillati TaxID=1783272 RepID=UPI003F88741B
MDLAHIHDDLTVARRVLAYAQTIAPCITSLTGEAQVLALAILRGAAASLAGSDRRIKSRQSGEWSRTYFSDAELGSVFSPDDTRTLAAMCPGSGRGVGPVGSFPPPDGAYRNLWP